jgi:hypothetical protein
MNKINGNSMSKDQSHILVIIVGGNISLHVKEKEVHGLWNPYLLKN